MNGVSTTIPLFICVSGYGGVLDVEVWQSNISIPGCTGIGFSQGIDIPGPVVDSGRFLIQSLGQFADFLGDVNGIGRCGFQGAQCFRELIQLAGGLCA